MQASAVLIFGIFYAKVFGGMQAKSIYFSQPYVFLVLINLIYDCIHQSKYEVNKIKSVALYALRLSFSALAINLLLKVDGLVDWRWKELFWPAWLFFALCVGLSFITLSLLATKVCMKMEGKAVDSNEIVGLGFLSLNVIGLIIAIVLTERYSEPTVKNGQLSAGLAGCFWFVSGYSIFLLAYFAIGFNKLAKVLYLQRSDNAGSRRSQRDLGAARGESNQIHTQYFLERLHPAVIAQSRLDLFKKRRPVAVLDHPKFLTMTASTLFKVAPEPPVVSLTAPKKSSILRREPRSNNQSAKKPDIKAGSLAENHLSNTASRTHKKTVSEYVQVRTDQPSKSSDSLSQSVVVDSEIGEHQRAPQSMIERLPAIEQHEENKENSNDSNASKPAEQLQRSLQPDLAQLQHSR